MLKNNLKQLSLYSILYDKIPENHILKLINNAVDFKFINKMLESSYSKYYGRPAKEPEMMTRLLVLQHLYPLSDERVIEETNLNLAYMWFVGINPEDKLPDPSLLAKFRTQRLKETTLDDIITEVVKQCVEKGIIKGTGISVDATHIEANTQKKKIDSVLRKMARKILKNLEEENTGSLEGVNSEIPDCSQINDPDKAIDVTKEYVDTLLKDVQDKLDFGELPKTEQTVNELKEILADPKFMNHKGVRSAVDLDARIGHKTESDIFFGYKAEFAMIADERIITAIDVHDGAYVDGSEFKQLYDKTMDSGVEIEEFYGDKAYFRKPILDLLKESHVEAIIPVSEMVYKIDESKYKYNKDSDQWFCEFGGYSVDKYIQKKKNGRQNWVYKFNQEQCLKCPSRSKCIKGRDKAFRFIIGMNTTEFYEYSQACKTEEFKEKYKKRASHEWKNGEIKRFHGLNRARGHGLHSVRTQAKLTALAVNLKRIAGILSSLNDYINHIIAEFRNDNEIVLSAA